MGEHSASDREGAGSSPASGPISANPSYAAFQLAKAFETSEQHHEEATRERAKQKVAKWLDVFNGIVSGSFRVGSRTPLGGMPAWATPEVVTGGFVTGTLMAGGPLQEHERALAFRLGLSTNDDRLALNRYFLTDEGLHELQTRLSQGTYEVHVPEEGALLIVAWLVGNGYLDAARDLIAEIGPFFSQLRFYPEPIERPRRFDSHRVFVQNVGETIERLQEIKPNQAILKQKETIEVWIPLYDEVVALFLETVEGDPPNLAARTDGTPERNELGRSEIIGGWPCRVFPADWAERAAGLVERFEQSRQQHVASARPVHRKSSLAQIMPYLKTCVSQPELLTGRDVGRIRQLLARYVAKRGPPKSTACSMARERQVSQASTPLFHLVAEIVVQRLTAYGRNEGVDDLTPVTSEISEEEAALRNLTAGSELPAPIVRKVERCRRETVEALVDQGLIPSGEVLAKVLPQVTAELQATSIADPVLRQVHAAVYRAFRRRRSLLLLNLQSQVKIEELPWVAAIEPFRSELSAARDLARQGLSEVVRLALIAFPHAILPNKLLQELRTLAKTAELEIPIIDELATDIFMGKFSDKYTFAAKQAAEVMQGTLYQRYFGIAYDEILQIPLEEQQPSRLWSWRSPAKRLADVCCVRAGVAYTGYDPAGNGMIIEQQQIVTTQNLATLYFGLGLADSVGPQLVDMAKSCFEWICRRQQANASDWHARLIMVKNTAYAWRQMLFFLSFASAPEVAAFIAWANEHFWAQPQEFQARFLPAFTGLVVGSQGVDLDSNEARQRGARRFLGWSKSRHWLLS